MKNLLKKKQENLKKSLKIRKYIESVLEKALKTRSLL